MCGPKGHECFIFNIPDISSEPLSLQGIIADGQISLQWDEPLNDGGASIFGYNIYRREDQTEFSLTAELVEGTSYPDVGIVNGGKYSYYVTAVNVMGESNGSMIIDVVDIDKPEFVSQSTPSYATTGDIMDIKVEFSDNVITSSVYLNYWFTEDTPINVSINFDGSKWWEHSIIVPPDRQLNLNYYFVAIDPTGNWINTSTWSIEVIDNDPPFLIDLEYPSTLFAGGNYFFNATTEDNIGIFKVELFYRYNNGQWENITLDPYENKLWSSDLEVIDIIGKMELYYKAWDTSGNVNISDYFQITVKDNTAPLLVNLSYPEYGFTGDAIQIHIESFDSIGINRVYCHYWFGEDEPNFEHMTFHQNYSTSIAIPIDRIDILYFNITSEDISHNDISTTVYEITILDNILPIIDPISNIELDLGDILSISIKAQDNVGVANIYWMSNLSSGSGSSINLTMAEAGDFIFNITIEDTSGNAVYHEFIVTVNDKIFDNDNDGIPDIIEMIHGLDPFDPDDAKLDLDTDGLSNILEYQLGTNISNKDTDMDGMPDGWEFNHNLDPLTHSAKNDQDEDGKTDLQEYLDGTNPNKKEDIGDNQDDNKLIVISILIILCIILVIGAMVLFIIMRRKKPIEEKTPEDDSLEEGPVPSDETTPSIENGPGPDDPSFNQTESPLNMAQEEEVGGYDQTMIQNEETVEPPVEGEPGLPEEGIQEDILEHDKDTTLISEPLMAVGTENSP